MVAKRLSSAGFDVPDRPYGWNNRLQRVLDALNVERQRLMQLQDEAAHLRRSAVVERLQAARVRIEHLSDEADEL